MFFYWIHIPLEYFIHYGADKEFIHFIQYHHLKDLIKVGHSQVDLDIGDLISIPVISVTY